MFFDSVFFIIFGYLLGSILFGRISAVLFHHKDFMEKSPDKNPGTANAFLYGGFFCGIFTLLGDILKGFLPVYFYLNYVQEPYNYTLSLVLAAPVIGHIFPLFYKFKGGKGIAASFGCLLALIPHWQPLAIFALVFIFFSTILKISPNYYRTIWAYIVSLIIMFIIEDSAFVVMGFAIIVTATMLKLRASDEEKDKVKVSLLWMH